MKILITISDIQTAHLQVSSCYTVTFSSALRDSSTYCMKEKCHVFAHLEQGVSSVEHNKQQLHQKHVKSRLNELC